MNKINVDNYLRRELKEDFKKFFWKKNFSEDDEYNFKDYIKLVRLNDKKISTYRMSKDLSRSYTTISSWKRSLRKPKLIYMLDSYLDLGKPKFNHVWLWINLGHSIATYSNPIEVPLKIKNWEDIQNVLNQMVPLEDTISMSKEECFAFIMGMMAGDVGKLSHDRDRLDLQLTKNSTTNKYLGEFFCTCLRKLGLRVSKIKDVTPIHNTKGRFRWISQSSPFFQWIYNAVLGLKNEELTTYNSLRMEWILNTPLHIKKRFLQGIFESDGSVLYDCRITCAVHPNVMLIQNILKDFDIKSYVVNDDGFKVLKIEGLSNLVKSHKILFCEEIKTKRYRILDRIVGAENNNNKRTPDSIKTLVKSLHRKGFKGYQISKYLLLKHNYVLSRRTIGRITKGGEK